MKDDLTSKICLPIVSSNDEWSGFCNELSARADSFLQLLEKYGKNRKSGFYLTNLKLKVKGFGPLDEIAAAKAIAKHLRGVDISFPLRLPVNLKLVEGRNLIEILLHAVEVDLSKELAESIRQQQLVFASSIGFNKDNVEFYLYRDLF